MCYDHEISFAAVKERQVFTVGRGEFLLAMQDSQSWR